MGAKVPSTIESAFSLTSFLPLTMALSAFFLHEKKVHEN
jgi:hypothetical protein